MDKPSQLDKQRPAQSQPDQPGSEQAMRPRPLVIRDDYRGSGKLLDRAALVTGGDSGIGRAVAVHFAREGANVAIVYLNEHEDAEETRRLVEAEDRRCLTIAGDVANEAFCGKAVEEVIAEFDALDVLVNNAGQQFAEQDMEDVTAEQIEHTFRTNVFSHFFMVRAALPQLEKRGGCIIATASVTAYRGTSHLIDYSATKGAIVALIRTLAQAFAPRGIRVNGVAPGPIWTPLIPATFSPEHVEKFGSNTLMGRAGQPSEVAPAYVFLASADASYFTGQVLHPNGGDVMM